MCTEVASGGRRGYPGGCEPGLPPIAACIPSLQGARIMQRENSGHGAVISTLIMKQLCFLAKGEQRGRPAGVSCVHCKPPCTRSRWRGPSEREGRSARREAGLWRLRHHRLARQEGHGRAGAASQSSPSRGPRPAPRRARGHAPAGRRAAPCQPPPAHTAQERCRHVALLHEVQASTRLVSLDLHTGHQKLRRHRVAALWTHFRL